MKAMKSIFIILIITVMIMISMTSETMCAGTMEMISVGTSKRQDQAEKTVDTNNYRVVPKPNVLEKKRNLEPAAEFMGPIVKIIQIVGTIIAFIGMIVLGIKYMLGSVEQRADYKKTMIPYAIGCVLIFTISTIVGIIGTIALQFNYL